MARKDRDFTSGSSLGNVLYMGIPSMIGFAATNAYALIDIFWIGLLGKEQVAAITLFQAFAFVLSSTNMLIGSGSVAIISRRFGAKDLTATRDVIRQTILLKLMVAVTFGSIGFFLVDEILSIMDAEASVLSYGIEYGLYYMAGLPFIFTSFTMFTALRGIGQAPRAMRLMLSMTALNLVLDPILILDKMPRALTMAGLRIIPEGMHIGFGLGIKGAAIARAISTFICVIGGIWMLRHGTADFRFGLLHGFRPNFEIMLRIIKIGIPPGIQNVLRNVMNFVTTYFVALFGTTVVASFGFSFRILQMMTIFSIGLSLGTSAIVGMNLGAGKPDKASSAVRTSVLIVAGLVGLIGIVIVLFAPYLMSVFTVDADVIEVGIPALRIMVIGQIMIAIRMVVLSAFNGSGNTWPPAAISAIGQSFRIALIAMLIYVFNTDQIGIWWAFSIAATIETTIAFIWFSKGHWKHREV
ncbi:MAG: MATE family efflux transporter [Candidatus Coatesbacteria bacterium]|nr:MATE family efflux transporter [Candidatus Coatesbacteria bacterium]